METVIREGTLRLQTTETSCDVILSCQGHRLMAHKLILSIASPVLRDVLLEDLAEPAVIVFPDISGTVMSLILDYIYTGNVIVYSNGLQDFLSAASLLKLHLDLDYLDKHMASPRSDSSKASLNDDLKNDHLKHFGTKDEIVKGQEKIERLDVVSPSSPEFYSKKTQRKLPHLVPINSLQNQRVKVQRKLCNYVIPSPWCPRLNPVLGDPRNDYLCSKSPILHDKLEENDNNNNFQYSSFQRHFQNQISSNSLNNYYYLPKDNLSPNSSVQSKFNKYSFERHLPHKKSISRHNFLQNTYPDGKIPETPTIFQENYNKNIPSTNTIQLKSLEGKELFTSTNNAKLPTQGVEAADKIKTALETTQEPLSTSIPTGDSTKNNLSNTDSDEQTSLEACEDGEPQLKYDRQKPFKCEDCGKSFSQLRNYKYHRSVHEGTKEFAAKCPECGKVFNDRGYLSSHMKIHRDRKEYACPHCPKRFNQRVAYNMHLRIHTGVKPHECPTCGKSFSRKMLLKQHQRVHTGERPYSCPQCGKTFADRSNMSLHARLHTGVKPYACNLCPKSFTKKHHLKTHMNFHTGLKPYTCQKCGLAFSQSSNMRTHYKKCVLKNATPTDTNSTNSENNGNQSS